MTKFRPNRHYYDPQKITILHSPGKTDYAIYALHYNFVAIPNINLTNALDFVESMHKKFNHKYQCWKAFHGFDILKKEDLE